jgi:glycosyltransferase involved in cell wall biosynthesis
LLKISYLITRSDTVGGAHVHLLDLASRAQADGHTVEVLVGGGGLYAALLRDKGLKVVNLRYLVRPITPHLDALAVLECWRAFRRFKPDIVHVHSTKAGLVGRAAAKLAGLPVVFTAHGWAFTEGIAERSRRFAVFLEKCAARLSDAIICVSEYDRQLALRMGVGNALLLTRIHNGVPEVSADQRSIPEKAGALRVICVARLDAPKDHALLLDALAMIEGLPWVLELIGDGPLTQEVRQKARDLGLADRVEFSGLCNDVASRLAGSDVFVLASGWEGLPLSILEAMRAGLPVVASDVGGVSESVTDEVTGFLIPKGDKTTLANRLMRLLSDAALRRKMGLAGRAAYEREFSFEVMYQRTQQVYQDVLMHKATRRCRAC